MSKLWQSEEDIDPFDNTAVRQHLVEIETDFNHRREQLYYRMQSYYHQSIAGNYNREGDLFKLLTECENLKKQYNDFKKMIGEARGTSYII